MRRPVPEAAATPDHPVSSELELLPVTEAAELVRAPVATLRYWRHLGTGPRSFRLGRRVVYRLADVCAWVEAQDHGSGS
ncbi:MAG: Transcriptional repressor, dcmR family [Modestobacter sp.]|nr:Transcriptional repressor, dcmR family [Modestobacter sp.]MCW2618294.1 Transcriptional repressor, dcmR family [Modestobacter sp.]